MGLDGAAITTFASGPGAETMDASDAVSAGIDELQLDLGIGPGWDADARQTSVLVPDLAQDERWPALRDGCLALGSGALFAFPLAFGGMRIGAVTTYAVVPRTLDADQVARLAERSRSASMLLLLDTVREAERETSQNPRSRRTVHQATGMVLARFGLTPPDALALLQAHAFSVGSSVTQVAADIVEGRSRLLDPEPPATEEIGGELR
ncbi:GAF and ANTAR domain-containing protein [Agrococcus jejuensis]|nr:GAF and ANTAR domain-containing protein [Agrococcus jejuensis]